MLFRICIDMEDWLAKDPENVAVVHCYDGTGRTMMVCAAFMRWAGWFATTRESLDVCLSRRNLPMAAMLPSQLRFLDYFNSIMEGEKVSAAPLRISRVTLTNVPDMENGSCSPFIEIFNQNKIVYASYRKGSKTKGVVAPLNKDETVVWKPDAVVIGNVFVRVRHACSVGAPETVFRVQFHTGFVKLFKIELNAKEMDASVSLSDSMTLQFDFLPVETQETLEMGDPIEDQLVKDSSPLWNEIKLRKDSNDTTEAGSQELRRVSSVKEIIAEVLFDTRE